MRLIVFGGLLASLLVFAFSSSADEVVQQKDSVQSLTSYSSENKSLTASLPLTSAAYSLSRYILSQDSYELLRLNIPSKQSIIDKILSDLEPTRSSKPATQTASSNQND